MLRVAKHLDVLLLEEVGNLTLDGLRFTLSGVEDDAEEAELVHDQEDAITELRGFF
jgi:hypothetical protein